jgi:cytochrome c oxidase cbb3-type subunit I/II
MDPTSMSPGSIMPPYPWLITQTLDISTTPAKIRAMQTLGVPYRDGFAEVANENLKEQADVIAKDLKQNNIKVNSDKEIIALIAYLQRMGTDIKANKTTIPSNQ